MLKHLSARSNHWRTKALGLTVLRNSRLTRWPVHSRALTTESFFSFGSSNQWGKEMNDDLTKSLLARYFAREDGRTDSVATTLSPDVLASMVTEVTRDTAKVDYKTIDMLVEQAIHAGSAYTGILETLIRFHMKSDNVVAASNVLCRCDPARFAINERLCMDLISKLMENCNWHHALKTAIYMLYLDYDFPSNALLFIVGGLNNTTAGVIQVLELLKVITLKKRTDLTQAFSYTRVNNFSVAMSGAGRAARSVEPLPAECLQDAMQVALTQLRQSGWFACSLTKMLVAQACAAGHEQLAADFVRETFQACVERDLSGAGAHKSMASPFQNPYKSYTTSSTAAGADPHTITAGTSTGTHSDGTSNASSDMDLLGLLRSFAEGDGIAERRSFINRLNNVADYSPATVAILQLCWDPTVTTKVFQQGPMICMNMLNNYWVLAYRCRDVAIDLPESSQHIPFEALDAVDAPTKELYDALMRFYNDKEAGKAIFSPIAGFERRNFRILCDAFGFEHKLIAVPDDPVSMDVEVRKHASTYDPTALKIEPMRYSQLLRRDAKLDRENRMIDNCPLFWPQAAEQLRAMPDEKLCVVARRLLNAMYNYASPSWALLVVEILREREIPFPSGTLRSILRMCFQRKDIYSLLEVLRLAHSELILSRSAEYQQKLHFLRNHSKYASHVSEDSYMHTEANTHEEEDAQAEHHMQDFERRAPAGSNNAVDGLNRFDWNNACALAFRAKHANLPSNSYQKLFAEMLQLMRQCNMELNGESMLTMLRFLLHTDYHADHRWKLIKRICEDSGLHITHHDCAAMAFAINKRIQQHNRLFKLNSAGHGNPNYLQIFPDTLHKMSSMITEAALRGQLGSDFRTSFEISWSRLHSAAGRKELYELVTELLHGPHSEENAFVVSPNPEARDAVAVVSVYAAYLLGCYDGEHRAAFTLLASMERMYRQADKRQSQAEAQQRLQAEQDGSQGSSSQSSRSNMKISRPAKSRRSAAYEAAAVAQEGSGGEEEVEEAPKAPRKVKQPQFEGRDLDMY